MLGYKLWNVLPLPTSGTFKSHKETPKQIQRAETRNLQVLYTNAYTGRIEIDKNRSFIGFNNIL